MNELILLKLSIQKALVGLLYPDIYCISAKMQNKNITLNFYLEKFPNEEIQEDISCIETEVIADFDDNHTISTNIIISPRLSFSATEEEIVILLQKYQPVA